MGKKKPSGVSHTPSKTVAAKASKYNELTELNDKLLAASALAPAPKDLQSSCELIYQTVEKIRLLQNELKPQTTDAETPQKVRERNFDRFVTWCAENCILGDKVELQLFEGLGVGLKATQRIQHHEMFLSVPRKAMMTVDRQSKALGSLLESDPIVSRMPNIALSLYLLTEKFNKSSSWRPYLDVLPVSYDTPLYFTPQELSLLKGTSCYEQAVGLQRNISRQYAYFWALFINQADKYPLLAKNFTYDAYRWAVSTVMTRQNVLPPEKLSSGEAAGIPQTGSLALIPYWDMCNHKPGEMLTDYDEDMNECHCYALTVYEAGDQVFICYGIRSNAEFLVHNGFVDLDNPYDTVQIKLGLSKSDPYIATKRALLERYNDNSGDVQAFNLSKTTPPIPHDLLTFLRVFHATEDELKALAESDTAGQSPDEFKPISRENDRKCWTYLRDRCNLLLRMYKSDFSNSEDLNAVHVEMIKNLIDGEKTILMTVVSACEQKLKD